MKSKRVVITGVGPIGSLGIGKKAYWAGMLNKSTGLEKNTYHFHDEKVADFYIHKVKDFDIKNFGLDSQALEYISQWKESPIDRDTHFLMAAIKLALEDSGITNYEKNDFSLIVSHENPNLEQLLDVAFTESYQFLNSHPKASKTEYFHHMFQKVVKSAYETQSFMLLFHLAKVFHVKNFSLYVNNACASGMYSLEVAANLLQSGKANKVVVVGGDCPDLYKLEWFKLINMYDSSGTIKPFSNDGKGFVLGEGAAALVLETYDEAVERGAPIYAEYIAGEFMMEGWKVTLPNVTEKILEDTILGAIDKAKIKTADVDLVCGHGVGTRISDGYEARSIHNVFKDNNGGPFVTAFKPYLGHNLGGCTLLEIILLLLSMKNNTIPAILNTTSFLSEHPLKFVSKQVKKDLNVVVKTCSAFAGYNSAVVLKKIN